jgi:hypothetical protein
VECDEGQVVLQVASSGPPLAWMSSGCLRLDLWHTTKTLHTFLWWKKGSVALGMGHPFTFKRTNACCQALVQY